MKMEITLNLSELHQLTQVVLYGEQAFSNGIIGNGNILTNLPGSANGNFYYVVVRDNNDPPCIVADGLMTLLQFMNPKNLRLILLIFKKIYLFII